MGGQRITVELPCGIAVSREALDTRLIAAASDAGADVFMPCKATVQSVEEDHVAVTLGTSGGQQARQFAAVVIAAGLNASGLQGILPWTEMPNGPFGVSLTASSDAIEPGVIYMACDDDGYVGLVRLENDRVDIAAAIASGSNAASLGSPQQRVQAILSRSQFPAWTFRDHSPLMTTPPLRRTRLAGSGRVMAIGDAAGYVEPFTGEGMTWAMQSGIAAADLIAASIDDLSAVGPTWDRQLRRLLRRKKLACRTVTGVLRSPLARRVVARSLASWPGLANPLIRSLAGL